MTDQIDRTPPCDATAREAIDEIVGTMRRRVADRAHWGVDGKGQHWSVLDDYRHAVETLVGHIAALREGLETYADPAFWETDPGRSTYIPRSDAERDRGDRARALLERTTAAPDGESVEDVLREGLEYVADSAIGNVHSLSPANGSCTLCLDVQGKAREALRKVDGR